MDLPNTYTAFEGANLLFRGSLQDVVMKIKKRMGKNSHTGILLFSDSTGKLMDFNFHGSEKEVLKRLEVFSSEEVNGRATVGPGRPKLGVISREVSLLPRHWEWLASQSEGTSASIRRLIEEAIKKSAGNLGIKQLQERCYKVMSVLAGDRAGYEEALRALYKKDEKTFFTQMKEWPKDIQKHISEMAEPIFKENN